MKKKTTIFVVALLVVTLGVFLNYEISRPIVAEAACSVPNCKEQGGARWTIGSGGSLDVLSSGELDMETGSTFKVGGVTIVLPTTASAFLLSTLTTNAVDAANSLWGVSNGLTFEVTASANETTLTATNPTADRTVTMADATGTIMLSTLAANGPSLLNSVTGASNQLIWEGTADDFETILTATDATADVTVTVADGSTGTVMVSSLATNAPDIASSVTGASNALVYEGTLDAFETSLSAVDPLEDNTITLPEESGGVMLTNIGANADIDDASASTNWTASDTANWTIDVGTSNSRSGGNSLEFKTDATDNDEIVMDNGSVITAAAGDNYLGFWMRNDGGTIAATELDVDLRTPSDTVITNCGALQIPAMAQDDWTWVEFDTSTCDLSRFQKLAIVADTGITANTAIDFDAIITYDISNSKGPARGRLEYVPISSGTVTRGEFVCAPGIGTETNGVETCGANDFAAIGIACSTSTTFVIIQTSGIIVVEIGNSTVDNADLDVLSGAVTVDDAGSIENSVGWGMETGNDANDFIYMRTQF